MKDRDILIKYQEIISKRPINKDIIDKIVSSCHSDTDFDDLVESIESRVSDRGLAFDFLRMLTLLSNGESRYDELIQDQSLDNDFVDWVWVLSGAYGTRIYNAFNRMIARLDWCRIANSLVSMTDGTNTRIRFEIYRNDDTSYAIEGTRWSQLKLVEKLIRGINDLTQDSVSDIERKLLSRITQEVARLLEKSSEHEIDSASFENGSLIE